MNFLQSISLLLGNILDYADLVTRLYISAEQTNPFAHDTTIEGMRSQDFSVGMFYFLAFCILVFVLIVFAFLFKGKQNTSHDSKECHAFNHSSSDNHRRSDGIGCFWLTRGSIQLAKDMTEYESTAPPLDIQLRGISTV